MNNDLFDRLVVDLLRTPLEHCSATNVAEVVEPKAAADCTILPFGERHQEPIKLAFITEHLAPELGIQRYSVSLHLSDHNDPSPQSLQVLIREDATDDYLIGDGRTAEQALRDLHLIPRHSGAQ